MPSGGARAGAGRKPGAANQKTREVADKALKEGISPLEVMLLDMREKFEKGDLSGAADRACDCAPFLHARLSSSNVQIRNVSSIQQLTNTELAALARESGVTEEDIGASGPHGLH